MRDHYGVTQVVFTPESDAFKAAESREAGERYQRVGQGHRAGREENINPTLPTGRIEVGGRSSRGAVSRRGVAVSSGWHAGDSGRAAAAVPLPRSSARQDPRERGAAIEGDLEHPPPHGGTGISRVSDSDPDIELARRRAGLSRSQPHSPGQVLRPAAGASAVQAAADGVGLRSVLPDRAVLPRRGCPRRPVAGRVLSARPRDVVRRAGRCVRGDRAGVVGAVFGVFRLEGDAPLRFRAFRIRRR